MLRPGRARAGITMGIAPAAPADRQPDGDFKMAGLK
jgi:hypothetical protein